MNGKPVGGMTEVELQIEMDVCGPDLLLVVSRFDVQDSNVTSCANNTLEDLAMDWNDVGAGVSSTKKRVSFGASNNQTSLQHDFYEHESCSHFTDKIESQEYECEDLRTEIITTQVNTEKSLSMQERIHQPRRNDESIAVDKISQQNLHDSSVKTNLGLPLTPKKKAKTAANPKRLPSDHNDKQSFHQKSNIAKHKRESAALDKYRKQLEELSDSSESEVEHIKPNHQNRTSTEKRKEKSGSIVVHPEKKANPAVNKSHQTAAMGRTRNMYANNKDVAKHQHSSKPKALDRYRKHVDDPSDYSESEDEEPRRNSSTRHYPKPNKTGKENCRRSNGNSKSVDTDYSDESSAFNSQEEDENDDENPWLGCVCGRTHPPPIKVFWIQCESCEAWYNVAEGCIGFNSEDANSLEEWSCWACKPPVAGLGL